MDTNFSQNLIYLRNRLPEQPSQRALAPKLGIHKSSLAAYEAGRSQPKYEDLIRIADFYGISTDDLLRKDLRTAPVKSRDDLRVLVAAVDAEGEERVVHIPVKASAGYAREYGNPEYIQQLDAYRLPFLPGEKTYRSYEIEGDSMLPLKSGTIVFAQFVENWRDIRDGSLCLVTTRNDGLVFKKVFNYLKEKGCLLLVSTNERYKPFILHSDEVLEIWRAIGYYSTEFPLP